MYPLYGILNAFFQLHSVNQSIAFLKRFYPENTVGFRKCYDPDPPASQDGFPPNHYLNNPQILPSDGLQMPI